MADIGSLYNQLLGRSASAEEIAFWQQQAAQGTDVASAIGGSSEARSRQYDTLKSQYDEQLEALRAAGVENPERHMTYAPVNTQNASGGYSYHDGNMAHVSNGFQPGDIINNYSPDGNGGWNHSQTDTEADRGWLSETLHDVAPMVTMAALAFMGGQAAASAFGGGAAAGSGASTASGGFTAPTAAELLEFGADVNGMGITGGGANAIGAASSVVEAGAGATGYGAGAASLAVDGVNQLANEANKLLQQQNLAQSGVDLLPTTLPTIPLDSVPPVPNVPGTPPGSTPPVTPPTTTPPVTPPPVPPPGSNVLPPAKSIVDKIIENVKPGDVINAAGTAAGVVAANAATNAQQQSASDATAEARRQYDLTRGDQLALLAQQRADQAPWLTAGTGAINRLASLLQPGGQFTKSFTQADFQADPGYAFRQAEGQKALERSAAARGGLLSGAALKATERYSQGLASEEYTNAYNRFNNDQSTQYNRLASLAGVGQQAVNQVGQAGQSAYNTIAQAGNSASNNIQNNITGAGNARASGYAAMTNAITNGAGQYFSNQQSNNLINALNNRGNWWNSAAGINANGGGF